MRRKTRARSSSSWPRRTASWATRTATSRASKWSRRGSASSIPPAGAGRCRPKRSAAWNATPSILAVGEAVDLDFVRASGLRIKESGTLEVDRYTLETSRSKFYAGGDLISGASNVSNAMGYGKKAARKIDQRLMGAYRWDQIDAGFEYGKTPPASPAPAPRHRSANCRRGTRGELRETMIADAEKRWRGVAVPALRHQGSSLIRSPQDRRCRWRASCRRAKPTIPRR